MSAEANKTNARRIVEEYFNQHNERTWDELVHPDVTVHGVAATLHGANEAKPFYNRRFAAFPDWHCTIDDLFGENDRVAIRGTESGTRQGPFLGMAPTGKRFTRSALQILRFETGKLGERWGARDTGSQMRHLGLTPPPGPPPAAGSGQS